MGGLSKDVLMALFAWVLLCFMRRYIKNWVISKSVKYWRLDVTGVSRVNVL